MMDGVSNWKLTVRREGDHIAVLRAVTCDIKAALPEALFGLPVTVLGDRALSPSHAATGEDVELAGGPAPGGAWDNSALTDLALPSSLTTVGDYGLYGCKRLRTLRLSDRTCRWGGGVLIGCPELGRFLIDGSGREEALTAFLAKELSRELEITLRRDGVERAALIFPEYMELFEENCPAHLFNCNISGAGLIYRQIFGRGGPLFAAYDGLWPSFLSRDYDPGCAMRLAWNRLRLPEGLSERAREEYRAYIRLHALETGRWLIGSRDGTGLRALLELAAPDPLSPLLDDARRAGFTEAAALLLEARRTAAPAGLRKSFDL